MPSASPNGDGASPQPPAGGLDGSSLAGRLKGINLYLVGMMGTGKSAVGRPLAERLGYTFLDADDTIARAAGRSIPELFELEGEEGFRRLETQVLNQIACLQRLVVATGGGVVTRPENWGHLRQGVVVWLDAPAPLLLERLQADPTPRPLLQAADPAARLAELMERRTPLYAQADLRVVQDGRGPAAVADQVLDALPAILREQPQAPAQPVRLVDADGGITTSLN